MLKNTIFILSSLILFTTTDMIHAQSTITFDKNIHLPAGISGGTMVYDILYAEGKIFLYAPDKVLVYNAANNAQIATINLNNNYGKYNPLYYYERLWVADNNMMTYNSDNHLLYIAKPNMDILVIDISNNQFLQVANWGKPLYADGLSLSNLRPVHGLHVIKYDNTHHRLYWLVRGRNATNVTGYFHARDSFIGIYKISGNGTIREEIDTHLFNNTDYTNSINDVEFNENNNYFYLVRKLRVDIFEITQGALGQDVVDLEEPFEHVPTDACKFSKLLNVNSIHKIIAIPYRLPADASEPPLTTKIHFYVIDGNTNTHEAVIAPHKLINDAVFIPDGGNSQNGYLMMCFGPNGYYNYYMQGEPEYANIEGSDIAVYRYKNGSFDPAVTGKEPQFIQTGNNSLYPYNINYNRPFKLLVESNNSVIVSKTHEIIRINKVINNGDTSFVVEASPLVSGISDHFFTGVKAGGKLFILNMLKNGMEVINGTSHTTTQTGFPVYDAMANPANGKIYFYNKLNSHNTSIFVYNTALQNGDGAVEAILSSEAPIGDMIYDSYTQKVLFSENYNSGDNQPVKVRSIDNNNTISDVISLTNVEYLQKLFISPNNRLYVTANMRNTTPVIYMYNATDYTQVGTAQTVTDLTPPENEFTCFIGDFCYNIYDNNTYAIIGTNNAKPMNIVGEELPLNTTLDPYFSTPNSTMDNGDPTIQYPGVFFKINDNGIIILKDNLNGARQIVCANPENPEDNYSGEIFINNKGSVFMTPLLIYDVGNSNFYYANINFNEMAYSSINGKLYGFSDEAFNGSTADRVANIYRIDNNNNVYTAVKVADYNGQLASFFYNKYDNMLYLNTKVDGTRLGIDPMGLYQLDPTISNGSLQSVSLTNKSFYTEVDNDYDYHYYNYNLTTPYIDPYSNKMYLPNGGHSNVSVVDFVADEPLILNPYDGDNGESFTWLSFPRLRNSNPSVQSVLGGDNIEPNSDPYKYQTESQLENLPLGNTNEVYNIYTGTEWPTEGQNLTSINATLGYKLTLKYNSDPNQAIKLFLHGTVLDPSTTIPQLYADKENWIGYWLYQTQDIFDALGSTADHITSIKHQDWTCVKTTISYGSGDPEPYRPPFWQCDRRNTNIKYGDMVILKGNNNIYNFQWNIYGNPPVMQEESSPQYYSYQQQADYTPVAILLDSTDQPLEIGVFENDTCIGANTVNDSDSVVVIRSYLSGNSSDSLTFEKYYGSKSTQRIRIADYYVRNNRQPYFEKRTIKAGEKADFFVVSFRKPKNYDNRKELILFKVWPNPASNNLLMEYTLQDKRHVTVEVFNTEGKRVAIPVDTFKNKGTNRTIWNLTGFSGKKLKSGLYLLKLTSGNRITVKKVLIQ